jgi:hypothetical protein
MRFSEIHFWLSFSSESTEDNVVTVRVTILTGALSLRFPRANVDGSTLVRPWLPPADLARALEVPVPCPGWSGDTLPNFSRTSAPTFDISTLGFRLFIANANGTFFGMSESLEASTRRWSSSHVPYDSTTKPKKFIYHIYLIQIYLMRKGKKKKSRSPINPQREESREKESQEWAGAEQANFLSAEGPGRARGLKGRACRVFVQARVAKGQRVQLSLEDISTMWSFDAQGDCPVTKPWAIIWEDEDNVVKQTSYPVFLKNPQRRKS